MNYDYNKLKGKIKEIYGTQEKFAESIGISTTSLINKLTNKTSFTQDEILKATKNLKISVENVNLYFFITKVE